MKTEAIKAMGNVMTNSIKSAVEKVLTPDKIQLKDLNFKVLAEGQKIGQKYATRKN